MKFLDTVNKKLQLLGEQEMGGLNAPQTPGSANPADATSPADQQQQPPLTPEEVDQQGKLKESDREADKELCLQVLQSLLEKIKDKIRGLGGKDAVEIADHLNGLYNTLSDRAGEEDLKVKLKAVLSEIQNKF